MESQATINLFNNISDESLNQKVYSEGRTLGYIAWHLVLTLSEMMNQTGLSVSVPGEDADMPNSAKDILDAYKIGAESVYQQVEKNCSDDMLKDELVMYGEKWRRWMVFDSLIRHQIHHRGQMTVLMRQAGLKVTGIYGPSKEEWQAMGMEPMK